MARKEMKLNGITENFAGWIITAMIDYIGRMLIYGKDAEYIRQRAKCYNKRIENQILPFMSDESRNYFLEEHGYNLSVLREMSDFETVPRGKPKK